MTVYMFIVYCTTVEAVITHTPSVDLAGYGMRQRLGYFNAVTKSFKNVIYCEICVN